MNFRSIRDNTSLALHIHLYAAWANRDRQPVAIEFRLEIGLRFQNSQLPQLNQFLQREILKSVLTDAFDEFRRDILHSRADDVVYITLEARRL